MNERPGFMVYFDDIRPAREYLDMGQLGRLLCAAMDYAEQGKEPTLGEDRLLGFAWATMRPHLDRDKETYRRKVQRNSENARKRWHCADMPPDAVACDGIPDDANDANYSRNINTNHNPSPTSTGASIRAAPPSLEEVGAYCVDEGLSVDVQKFYDHYEANGWMTGNSPVRDWKALARKWAHEDQQRPQPYRNGPQVSESVDGGDIDWMFGG